MTTSPQTHITLLAPIFPRASHALTMRWTDGHAKEPWQAQLVRSIAQSDWSAQHLPAAELSAELSAELICDSLEEPMTGTILPPGSALVCADPIHFRAERDSATLIPADMLQLREGESEALLKSINDFLQSDSLHIHRTASGQWLMSGKDARQLPSYPPSFLAHRNASAFLSDDEASGSWRRLMTELQMLLHTHPVNSEREQRGLLPVNSVWFWGGAPLSSGTPAAGITPQSLQLYADDSFTVDIARHLGLSCESLAAFDPTSQHVHALLVDTRLTQALFAGDEAGIDEAERHIVNQWIAPLHARIEAGENLELSIVNEDGMQGRLDPSIVQAAAVEARAVRISKMSLTERLGVRLAGGAGNLWIRLRNRLSGGA